jgi:ribosome maturation factor RimP
MKTSAQVDLEQISKITTPVIEGAGFELVDLEWKRDLEGWVLRVYIDKPGGPHPPGQGISLDGCADVSRELSTVLDVSDAVPGSDMYSLEVSSPGLDRPLRRARDFERAVGKKIIVKTRRPLGPPPGRRNFKGPLVRFSDEVLAIDVGDKTCDVPMGEIEKANVVFEPSQQVSR